MAVGWFDSYFDKLSAALVSFSSFGALVISLLNFKKIAEVHVQINSRMDQLLRASGLLAHAEGKAQEQSEQKEREKGDVIVRIPPAPPPEPPAG